MTRTFTGLAEPRSGAQSRRGADKSEPVGRETDSFKRTRPACVFPSFSSIAGEAWIHSFGRKSSVD
jgi:hypothetical protein